MTITKLADYKPSAYQISHAYLKIELDETKTNVTATLQISKNPDIQDNAESLVLNGGDFALTSIEVNGQRLQDADYVIENNNLKLIHTPENNFTVKISNTINSSKNTKLEGLYKTGNLLVTHCEAEGFRNITYYLDRPDVLVPITTELHADKIKFPILLSNGNLTKQGLDNLDPNRHFFIYEDPFPKSSYLFALVAGELELKADKFITRSGREVTLKIYAPQKDLEKTQHAINTLKIAMQFDEDQYDREFDLDIYNLVAVPQFNASAMENKGLNIFNNTSLIADSSISTDTDFDTICGTISHEYFHNWRGNRVTVKNWFQISLKEGFATITSQEFRQHLSNSVTPRISDIILLQDRQFKEDSSSLAHPVLPQEYQMPKNIYTTTVYKKGAELLSMLQSLLGKEIYKQGCSIYFAENDGKAAAIEDFITAMEKTSKKDLTQFLTWYHQAGTPSLTIEDNYDKKNKIYHLTIKQSCAPTPNQPVKNHY